MMQFRKAIVAVAVGVAATAASAGSVMFDFDGIPDGTFGSAINPYYSGVMFMPYLTVATDTDVGGSRAFANAPSGRGVMYASGSTPAGPPTPEMLFDNAGGTNYYGISFSYTTAADFRPAGSITVRLTDNSTTVISLPTINVSSASCPAPAIPGDLPHPFAGFCVWSAVAPVMFNLPIASIDFTNTGSRILFDSMAAIPEPATLGLLGLGLLAAVGASRRRRA